jgi:hypothetical protein
LYVVNMPFYFVLCLTVLFIFLPKNILFAQKKDSIFQNKRHIFSIGTQFHYGSIFAHSEAVENTSGSRPIAIQVDAIWQKISQKTWDNCNCYPKTGFSLNYTNYDNAVLGQSLKIGYFLEPNFNITKHFQLGLRGTMGVAYLSNPYDIVKNPNNQSYSLPFSAYLAVGVGTNIRISPHWAVGLSAHYQHISNGGMKEPNKGINWITSSLNVIYTPKNIEIPKRLRQPFDKKQPIRTQIQLFGSNRPARIGDKERQFMVGLLGQFSKQVSRLSALTAGVEAYYDGALDKRMQYEGVAGDGWRVGAMAGHQFLLGKFTFSQQIGVYLYQNNPYFDAWYHRWGVMYYPKQKFGMGFMLKAHKQVANFLDLRVAYVL